MTELIIRRYQTADLLRVVEIHKTSLPEDFLPSLGSDFLEEIFFPAISTSKNAEILIACHEDLVVGFSIISLNSNKLIKEIILYKIVAFLKYIFRSVIFSFNQLRTVFGILWSSVFIESENDFGELYIMAVDQVFRGGGIGKVLVNKSVELLKEKDIRGIKIKTLKTNNLWILFFKKNGWVTTSEFRIAGKDYVILSQKF